MITLATLPQATAQEVFSQVVTHLLKQSEKCEDSEGNCVYFNESTGLKCAAGCLIAKDEYSPEIENYIWTQLADRDEIPKNHASLIRKLQQIHDSSEPQYWIKRLKLIAKEQGFFYDWPEEDPE